MDLSNLLYLGVGIAVGLAGRRFQAKPNVESHTTDTLNGSPTTKNSITHSPDTEVLQQEIKQTQLAYEMVREMNKFKGGFLARTTHELRSPLNSIIGMHQLILSDLCENQQEEREFVATAHESALKLLKLMDEILNVARTEHGTNKLDIQPLQLSYVLEEVYNLTHLLAKNRNYPFKVVPPDSNTYVLADPRWLRQVLVNFVESSIACMEEGSMCISTEIIPDTNFARIYIDLPSDAVPRSEAVDLMKLEDKLSQNLQHISVFSPGMVLFLNQTLMSVMGGKLEIVSPPTTNESESNLSRLQLSIPLVTPDSELLE